MVIGYGEQESEATAALQIRDDEGSDSVPKVEEMTSGQVLNILKVETTGPSEELEVEYERIVWFRNDSQDK